MRLNTHTTMMMIASSLVTLCEPLPDNSYHDAGKAEKIDLMEGLELNIIRVKAREWRPVSPVERYSQVSLPSITARVIERGMVIVFMEEDVRKIELPFTYYQVRRAMSIQPSYEKGILCIHILGNFTVNIHSVFTFHAIIISPEVIRKHGKINWHDYDEIIKMRRQ